MAGFFLPWGGLSLKYEKIPLALPDQVTLLQKRGLCIEAAGFAEEFLHYTNYYRLSAYFRPFKINDNLFKPNSCFSDVAKLYHFDRKLRITIYEAIAAVEIQLRTLIAHHLSMQYGPFAHLDEKLFSSVVCKKGEAWRTWHEKLLVETKRSKELFIEHFKTKYDEYPELPIWVVTEVMSFNSLSFMYGTLNAKDSRVIASKIDLHSPVLKSWLHSLSYVRNLCAHHGRLWNRHLAIRPALPDKDLRWEDIANNRLFCILLVIKWILDHSKGADEIRNSWKPRTEALLSNPVNVDNFYESMGMPSKWEEHPLWVASPEKVSA